MVSQFDNHAIGYPVVVAGMAILGVIFHLVCYKGVKERHVIERPKEKGVNQKAFFNLVKNEAFATLAILHY